MAGHYNKIWLSLLSAVVVLGGAFAYEKIQDMNDTLMSLESHLASLESRTLLSESASQEEREALRREIVKQNSEEELLTAAVEEVAPTVVSVVATKDVPKLKVIYENPFGDDPFFRDFNVRIPRYIQDGTEEREIGAGTGFIVRSDGYIITNKHVVRDTEADYTVLLSEGEQRKAELIYRDPVHDIAVLKIPGSDYPYAKLGDSENLKLGQSVFAVGNVLGDFENTVSVGIVSGLNRDLSAEGAFGGTEALRDVIQTDAAINPGNSGGPLSNLEGEVIGVNVARVMGGENIGFALPVSVVRDILDEVL